MGNRLTRITTRGGDHGDSGLADGTRHAKTAPVFAALGDIDELNSVLGIVVAGLSAGHDLREYLLSIQSRLFDLGGAIATPGSTLSLTPDTLELEALVARYTKELGPLANFILPGGTVAGAQMHLGRAVCRRAERSVWHLMAADSDDYDESLAVYLNRLSDALFVFARLLNVGTPELLWQQKSGA